MKGKNKILLIHAKWLKDNGYFEQAKECVRQIRWGNKKYEMESKV